MADLHHQHGTTVVEERDGAGTAIMVLIAVAVIGFLIWLFAFSGVFGGDDTEVNIREGDRTENVIPPGDGTTDDGNEDGTTGGDTTTDGGTGDTTQDSP